LHASMKLRSPLLIRLVALVAAVFVRCWMSTMRIRVMSLDGREHPADPSRERFFYAFWHEGLLGPLTTKIKVQMLISQHADGELIAQVCQRLGYGVVRGSTTRGGCEAVLNMIRSKDRSAHLGITPDGPQGPRRKLQMGIIFVSSETNVPIVPVGIGFASAWRANSWDRFAVPIPFSTICGVVGDPIHVPPDLDRSGLLAWRELVEKQMMHVTQLAEVWAERSHIEGKIAEAPQVVTSSALRKAA